MVPIALVFDLDDTLYLERDFARSGFAAAGDWLQQELGIGGFAETGWRIFEAGDRARTEPESDRNVIRTEGYAPPFV